MLIYYNNMYVLMYFTLEKRFMWFCSADIVNIIV